MHKGLQIGMLSVALLASSIPAAKATDWDALTSRAKAEGQVMVYTAATASAVHESIAAAFTKKYGIKVSILNLRASEILERVKTEQASGKVLGDVFQNGVETYEAQNYQSERCDVRNKAVFRPDLKLADATVPNYVLAYGIMANTDLVRAEDAPKSWSDLLAPKWKGQILSDDPRALGGGYVMFSTFQNQLSPDFNERLAKQQLTLSRDIGFMERRVAQGEFPIRIPQQFPNMARLKGLPVKIIIPDEGVPFVRFDLARLKSARHPNAACLFIDFLTSDEVQKMYASAGLVPAIKLDESHIPPEALPLVRAKLLGTVSLATQEQMLRLAKQLYP